MAEARSRGGLRANRYVRLRKLFENGQPSLEIAELGGDKKVVSDRLHHDDTARRFRKTGMAASEDRPGVGLAHNQNVVGKAAAELDEVRKRNRQRDRSLDL
jgi:hypothetical protein